MRSQIGRSGQSHLSSNAKDCTAIRFSGGTGTDWCEKYVEEYALTSCEDQNNRVDLDGNRGESSVWYVLAAWTEEKTWCGTEFGFGTYDPDIYGFLEWGTCSPGENLEIPTENWPGPNEGTALTTTNTPWSGNLVPVYYFAGYAYYEGIIPLAADPATGFGGTGNCATPPESWAAADFGGMGLFVDGIHACPEAGLDGGDPGQEEEGVAVCCQGDDCFLVTADECTRMGGDFHPTWAGCDPSPCSGGLGPDGYEDGVCCLDDGCLLATEDECIYQHQGEWHPEWISCEPNPCNLVCPEGDARWRTIQKAVDIAESGWTIELCDHTFTGPLNRNIRFDGKALALRSRSGSPDYCKIDCEGRHTLQVSRRGFVFGAADTSGAVVQGLTIYDGVGGFEPT